MKTEIKVNVVSVILLLIIFLLLGYSINSRRMTGKERRALKDTISVHKHRADSLTLVNKKYQQTLMEQRAVISYNNEEILERDKKIVYLKYKIREAGKNDTIPSSEKYDILQIHTGFDSLPKPYAFSGRQIDTLYRDNEKMILALEGMELYDGLVDILNSNIDDLQSFAMIQDTIISTLMLRDGEKDIVITNLNKMAQDSKKVGRRAKILNWVMGGITAVVTYIAITK